LLKKNQKFANQRESYREQYGTLCVAGEPSISTPTKQQSSTIQFQL
jgi:hypothetical protein